jgi:cysteine desulfurase
MAVLEEMGFEIIRLKTTKEGVVDPEELKAALTKDTVLVSVMMVNNEIGSIEPVAEIGSYIREHYPETMFHVDAIQAFGKLRIYPKRIKIDLLSVSGHKIHGPKGVGFLYIDERAKLSPIIYGGGQQNGMRSGTENVAGIAGMGLAAKMLYQDLDSRLERLYGLREQFISLVSDIPDIQINGPRGREGAPHIISLTTAGVRAEVLLHALEEKGVYVSSGSACSTNRPHLSATLEAIRLPRAYMDNTIRLSLSEMNTEEDIRQASDALHELIPFLRRYTRH